VYLAARSEDRTKAAIEDLKLTTGNEAIWLKLDLASLNSVKAAAEEFLE
jgi:retinol dehydrogenase-12